MMIYCNKTMEHNMMQSLLEILIPTYNRKNYLRDTLEALTAPESPVRNLSITILDNASTDGTSQLVQEYKSKYPNIKHIRRNQNVGGNANIARAFEEATHEYFWILADDDSYDWSCWREVEQAIHDKTGLIVVNRELLPKEKQAFQPAELMRLLTFCPAAIHRKDTLSPDILMNIYYNTHNWFPHLGAVCAAINKKLSIKVISDNIVLTGKNDNHAGLEYHRKSAEIAYPYKMQFFEVGYLKSLAMLQDSSIRYRACERFLGREKSFWCAVQETFKVNLIEYKNNFQNYSSATLPMSFWQKIRFWTAIIYNHLLFVLLYPKYLKKINKFKQKLKANHEK